MPDLQRATQARNLAPILVVAVSAFVFALLLLLVRANFAPLESADHDTAAALNRTVAPHHVLVGVLRHVTWFGSNGVLWTVVVAGVIVLLIRRLWWLAAYLVTAAAGALVLDPILKSLIGRARPVVPDPISHGTGNSFPSGHALGSIACYGAMLLVFLPGVPPRVRTALKVVIGVLVATIGASRVFLGVHYVSDVVGAWALGVAWLGLTAYAFELARRHADRPAAAVLQEGLEPDAAADLEAAQPERRAFARHPGRDAAAVIVVWIFMVGIITGIGEAIVKSGQTDILGDTTIPRWFAAHRTATLTRWSEVASTLGATRSILIVAITTCVIALAVRRRWRPVIFVVAVMIGELALFLISSAVVKRPRPNVPQLDSHLPTHAYPSGHVAATLCVFIVVAILVIGHSHGWWRWLFLTPAIVMPVAVALSRLYRGEHHPTDVLGSAVFVALWLPAAYRLIRPNGDRGEPPQPAQRERRAEMADA